MLASHYDRHIKLYLNNGHSRRHAISLCTVLYNVQVKTFFVLFRIAGLFACLPVSEAFNLRNKHFNLI